MANRVENGWIICGDVRIKASEVTSFQVTYGLDEPNSLLVFTTGGPIQVAVIKDPEEFTQLLRDAETPDWIRVQVKKDREEVRAELAMVNANGR